MDFLTNKSAFFSKSKSFFIKSVTLFFLLIPSHGLYAQICLDGNYCPNPDFPGGSNCVGESVDEWGLAVSSGPLATSSSSTCHVQEIFGYADENNMYLGIAVGNQGTAFFYVYFDTDCDSTNNDQCHNGADFRVKFRIKNNGVIEAFALQEYFGPNPSTDTSEAYCLNDITNGTGIGGEYGPATNPNVVAEKGFIDGCSASNNSWVEVSFAIGNIFDICDPSTACTGVTISAITSQEGGSENSNDCESFPTEVPVPINGPPVAVVDTVPPCLYSDVDVCFDGSNSSDPDNNLEKYEWDFDYDGVTFDIDATGPMACNMYAPGSYTAALRVVDSFGCADTATTGTVDFIVLDANDKITANCVDGSILCSGNMDGVVSVNAQGGVNPISYLWSTGATTATVSGLGVGFYQVTLTDAFGCTDNCEAEVMSPLFFGASCSGTDIECQGDNDGSAMSSPTGGNMPYSYLWSNGATTEMISGLGAGTYDVTIMDANGCEAICSQTINEPEILSCAINGTDILCNTSNTGSADATVTGGTTPYSYIWSNGATSQDIAGLSIGTYSLSVTDANNCMTSCNVTIDGLVCLINQTDCDENNLKGATAVVSGGLLPYTYLWSTGETSPTIEGLIPGTYTLLVIDANDCETECEIVIERCFDCDESCETAFASLSGFENCFDDYGFNRWGWTNGLLAEGTHNFDLYADAIDCIPSNGELVGELIVNYSGNEVTVIYNMFGDYFMSLTNLYIGCDAIPLINDIETVDPSQYPFQHLLTMATTDTFTVNVNSLPCEGIYVIAHAEVCVSTSIDCEIIGTSIDCGGGNNGTADVSITGGLAPYNFDWSNGASTQQISGLSQGIYYLTITDANDCQSTCEILISYPPISAPQIGPFCQNDAPVDLSSIFVGPTFAGSWIGSGVVDDVLYPSNLPIGNYKIYYIDDLNCSSATIDVVISETCCPLDYAEVNGRLLIGTQSVSVHYQTDGILESVQTIQANTIYNSKLSITLKEEFEVLLGTTFEAITNGCDTESND